MSDSRGTVLAAVPNLLSITRMALTIPFAWVMLAQRPGAAWWGGALMIIAALTDRLDGLLARRFGLESEWGRILDPLADKIASATVVIVLLLLDRIPVWFVGAVLGRDALILAGGVALRWTRGAVLPSNETGKWAMGILAATLFTLVVNAPRWVSTTLMTASAGMLVLSLVLYVRRFAALLKTVASPADNRTPKSTIRNR